MKGLAAREQRRREAIALIVEEGWTEAHVARHFGVSREAVRQWHNAFRAEGEAGLATKPHLGPTPKLERDKLQLLLALLELGAEAFGFTTDVWTGKRVAQVIRTTFGVVYHPHHVIELLHQMDFSWQRPERRATERNDEEVQRWLREQWPAIKRGPRASGRRSYLPTRAASR